MRKIIFFVGAFVTTFQVRLTAEDRALDRTLDLAMINTAWALSEKELVVVKREVAKIFAEAGVDVRYFKTGVGVQLDPRTIQVRFSPKPLEICKAERIVEIPVGCAFINPATRPGPWAYIDVASVKQKELDGGLPRSGRLLGKVVVHEVCHILGLRHLEGGARGVMTISARWWDPKKFQYWNNTEIAHLRAALAPPE